MPVLEHGMVAWMDPSIALILSGRAWMFYGQAWMFPGIAWKLLSRAGMI
jgi:hypothetical protein